MEDQIVKDLTLLLLHLTSWEERVHEELTIHRAWKGFRFEALDALEEAGYSVVPIGITPQGRWLTGGDPLRRLSDSAAANAALAHANGIHAHMPDAEDSWALLPSAARAGSLPTIETKTNARYLIGERPAT